MEKDGRALGEEVGLSTPNHTRTEMISIAIPIRIRR
jgi:hypothetical protein